MTGSLEVERELLELIKETTAGNRAIFEQITESLQGLAVTQGDSIKIFDKLIERLTDLERRVRQLEKPEASRPAS
jgi:hypothetical protein